MSNKRKERFETVLCFVVVIILVLVFTNFNTSPAIIDARVVYPGLGTLFGTVIYYFKKEDKRDNKKNK